MKIKMSKWSDEGELPLVNWKDLISALVIAGYQVHTEKDCLVFELGNDDEVDVEEVDDE